jgi:hypothetical protein
MLLLEMLAIEFGVVRWHKKADILCSHTVDADVITTSTIVNVEIALNTRHHLLHIAPHDCKSIFQAMGKLNTHTNYHKHTDTPQMSLQKKLKSDT